MQSHSVNQNTTALQSIEQELRILWNQPDLEIKTPDDIRMVKDVLDRLLKDLIEQQNRAKTLMHWASKSIELKNAYPDRKEIMLQDYSYYRLYETVPYYAAQHRFWARNLQNVQPKVLELELIKTKLKFV